jgi:type II secretory pathway pseudopilin PulG
MAELLAAVAIVALLTALLVPGIGKYYDGANSSKCLSNLRQLSAAAQLYSSDNDGMLVPMCSGSSTGDARTWRYHLAPYLGITTSKSDVFKCPSDKADRGLTYSNTELQSGVRPASYGINFAPWLHQYTIGGFSRINKTVSVVRPSETIFLSDIGHVRNPSDPVDKWQDKYPRGANFGYARFPSDSGFTGSDAWNIFPRHKGARANVIFYEGHAASVDIAKEIIARPYGDPLCIYDNN